MVEKKPAFTYNFTTPGSRGEVVGALVNGDLKQTTTATASRTWKNKRSNWQNNSSARAF